LKGVENLRIHVLELERYSPAEGYTTGLVPLVIQGKLSQVSLKNLRDSRGSQNISLFESVSRMWRKWAFLAGCGHVDMGGVGQIA
jgi:hypothetical protein